MSLKPLLIEIGVEEIPAGVAPRMGDALKAAVEKLLADANVATVQRAVRARVLIVMSFPFCQVDISNRET